LPERRAPRTIDGVKRIFIVAALAVLSLGFASVPAHAVQTAHFEIVGVGHVTAAGIDCSRLPGGQLVGDCDELIPDGPDACFPEQDICFPQGGGLTFTAEPANGFQFTSWSHPQCNPRSRNPCGVSFAPGQVAPPNDVLTITATFTDVQDPTTALTEPGANAAVRGTIAVKATAADNAGTPRVALNAGGRILAQFTAPPFQTTFDTRTVPDGVLQFSSTATDSSNRTATQAVNVTVDNTNPTLTVTGPNNQTFGPGATPTWTLAAADATTAVNVRCSVVPVGQPANLGNCTSNTQERLVNPADGRYTLTVRATDAAGNFVEQTRAFAVDTGPPDTTITSGPDDGSSTEATSLTWGLGASELSTFECRLYLTAIGPGAFAPCSAAASHTVSGLAAGSYTFEARATDGFNNVDPTPVKRTVTIVSPPPVIPPPVVHQTTIVQQVIVVALTFVFHDANKKTTRITKLVVSSVPAGSTVTARCPSGCAKKSLVLKNAKGTVSLKALAKKPLKAKTKITVTVSKPGAVSAVKVMQIQKGRAQTVQSFCQPPGAKSPGRCA
jgi:Bacterial Ig domain/Bacterial Ig-like domain